MAESETGQERTIPLTPRRRVQLREEGNIPKSQEINSALVVLVGLLLFYFLASRTFMQFAALIVESLESTSDWTFTEEEAFHYLLGMGLQTLLIAIPYLLMLAAVAILANILQVGFVLSAKPITPKLDRISPIQGMRRLFSWRGVAEMIKSIVKVAIVGYIGYLVVKKYFPLLPEAMEYSVWHQLAFLGEIALQLTFYALLVLAVLAISDYLFQRWQYDREHMMTPDELRRELRETEGDPHVRARVRQIQREMLRRRMMTEVPRADVVVTNPTEYAVALRYRAHEGVAPVMLAKGRGLVAARIRAIAEEHDIPLVENKPLAQALYKACDPGMEIPEDLYTAVAEVLAYVHKMGQLSREVLAETR